MMTSWPKKLGMAEEFSPFDFDCTPVAPQRFDFPDLVTPVYAPEDSFFHEAQFDHQFDHQFDSQCDEFSRASSVNSFASETSCDNASGYWDYRPCYDSQASVQSTASEGNGAGNNEQGPSEQQKKKRGRKSIFAHLPEDQQRLKKRERNRVAQQHSRLRKKMMLHDQETVAQNAQQEVNYWKERSQQLELENQRLREVIARNHTQSNYSTPRF